MAAVTIGYRSCMMAVPSEGSDVLGRLQFPTSPPGSPQILRLRQRKRYFEGSFYRQAWGANQGLNSVMLSIETLILVLVTVLVTIAYPRS